jgi:hypothetical protein
MKTVISCFWLLILGVAAQAQQYPLSTSFFANAYKNAIGDTDLRFAGAAAGPETLPDAVPETDVGIDDNDYRWQDSHEKERNIAFAACAASVIGAVYTATRSIESRSRAEDKMSEYRSLWYSSSAEEFAQVKSEYNEYRDEGNQYAIASAALGALALVGLGFAVYWSF